MNASVTAVQARGLVKRFGDLRAVDGIDLDVPRGMIFAILGPNGAGKTTLMRMLATLLHPDEGTASVMGHDLATAPDKVRGEIAMTGQFASLDEDLTGRENLVMLARLWGFRAGRPAIGPISCGHLRAGGGGVETGEGLFGGMRRRLDIAASLIVTPGVLFLDEPTTGLDPVARKSVWGMIRQLAGSGVTILLTTQYMDEADQLAARIAVIDHGKKIAEGTPRELKVATGSGFLHVAVGDPSRLDEAARATESRLGAAAQRNVEGATLAVVARTPHDANAALGALIDSGIELAHFSMGSPSLEEVFFALSPGKGENHERPQHRSHVHQLPRRSPTRWSSAGARCSSSSTCRSSCSW